MPTIFSHAVFASAIGKSFFRQTVSRWFWLLAAGCALLPDADVITRSFGAERGSMFAHRGITHSMAFALAFGALAAFFAARVLRTKAAPAALLIFFALATFSHPLLDMLTDGGSGVALFAPFSSERYFFPWRPIAVSPIGFEFFSARGVDVIISEIVWLWLPAFALLAAATLFRRFRRRKNQSPNQA